MGYKGDKFEIKDSFIWKLKQVPKFVIEAFLYSRISLWRV